MAAIISEKIRGTIQDIRVAHDTLDFEQVAKDIVRLYWDLYEVRPDIEELATWITNEEENILGYGRDIDPKSIGLNLIAFLNFIGPARGCPEHVYSKIEEIGAAFEAAADSLDLASFAGQLENWVDVLFECVGSHVRLPVTIEDDQVRIGRHCKISFNRTLRIPEDGKDYPLPANFGRLPICRVEEYAEKVPEKWLSEGGFFIPLYQKEALFLEFEGQPWRPCAAKVAIGRVNAVTGDEYDEKIRAHKQDYIVIPDQKWLDGINSGEGRVGQFVAMPLGKGYTVEAQVTDEEIHGGFQVTVFDPKNGRFPEKDPDHVAQCKQNLKLRKDQLSSKEGITLHAPLPDILPPAAAKPPAIAKLSPKAEAELFDANPKDIQLQARSADTEPLLARGNEPSEGENFDDIDALLRDLDAEIPGYQSAERQKVVEMGIAKGGSIKQEIVEDTYGADSWDEDCRGSIVIHIVNSEVFQLITGREAPPTPITPEQYAKYEIPWFDCYDEAAPALLPAKKLQHIKSIAAIEKIRGTSDGTNTSIEILPDRLRQIKTPNRTQRIADFVHRAKKSSNIGRFNIAARESTYAIDLLNGMEPGCLAKEHSVLLEASFQIRAEANLALERFSDAEGDASDCLNKNHGNLSALSIRAQALIGMGEHDLAIADANTLLSSNPSHPAGLRVLAEGYLGAGSYEVAAAKASDLLKLHPKDLPVLRIRAEAHLRNDKHAESMHDATAALIYGGPEVRTLLVRAEAFILLGNTYDARQDIEDVLRMDAENCDALILMFRLKKSEKNRLR